MTTFITPPRPPFRERAVPPRHPTAWGMLLDLVPGRQRGGGGRRDRPEAVLLDLDDTLVRNVPYNADPEAVVPMPYAREALEMLRAADIPLGVVAHQSGLGRGMLTEPEAARINERIVQHLGSFDVWALCPHSPIDGCACRKPRPGLVYEAARRLGVEPHACVVVGDVLSDVQAARNAGARPLLVAPRPPRGADLAGTDWSPDLAAAARKILGSTP